MKRFKVFCNMVGVMYYWGADETDAIAQAIAEGYRPMTAFRG